MAAKEVYNIFFCYRRDAKDSVAVAMTLYPELKADGYNCYYDVKNTKIYNRNQLKQIIEECSDFIIISDKTTFKDINSGCTFIFELNYALEKQKNIILVTATNLNYPQDLPNYLAYLANEQVIFDLDPAVMQGTFEMRYNSLKDKLLSKNKNHSKHNDDKNINDDFPDSKEDADESNADAEYDYSSITDFVCPTMFIPDEFIRTTSGTFNDGKTVEDIIDERHKTIQNLRRKGRKVFEKQTNNNDKNKSSVDNKDNKDQDTDIPKRNRFKEFMWWIAGADRELLYMCPGDHTKYVGFGTVILITALMAAFSSWFAFNYIITNGKGTSNGAYILAFVWGTIIMFFDRFITNTMYSDGKPTISWLKFKSGLPRIIISIFIGIVITAPLELRIFEDTIVNELAKEKQKGWEDYEKRKETEFNKEYEDKKMELNGRKEELQRNLEYFQNEASKTTDEPQFVWNGRYEMLEDSSLHKVMVENKKYNDWSNNHDKAERERDSIYNILSTVIKKIEQIDTNHITDLSVKIAEWEKTYKDTLFDEGLMRRIHILHRVAMRGDAEDDAKNDNTSLPWWSFPIVFLRFISSAVGLIMLFFILLDISPVLYKMMAVDGEYEQHLKDEKQIVGERVRWEMTKELYKIENSDMAEMSAFVFGGVYDDMIKTSKKFNEKIFKRQEKHDENEDDTLTSANERLRQNVIKLKEDLIKMSYDTWYQMMEKRIKKRNKNKDASTDEKCEMVDE